ncbi:MAG: 16S rRNA (uracil1498-N3)-methyltransferase [Pirellulaceae bacterium]|jgi:16S rRNA (uracil1498-N3)-methyltransferase
MSERYFASSPIESETVELDENESRHLSKVMRRKTGDVISVFDGSGAEFTATVVTISKKSVEISIDARHEVDRELPHSVELAVALPKGDRQRWLIEKCVELGVSRLVPLETSRGVAQPVEKAIARLQRAVIEASKQCRRNRLMVIASPMSIAEFSETSSDDVVRWIAHPTGELIRDANGQSGGVHCLIGPEGGFTDEEVATAESSGFQPVSFGGRILRIETAALYAAVVAGR